MRPTYLRFVGVAPHAHNPGLTSVELIGEPMVCT
jgi:hypothetical protein